MKLIRKIFPVVAFICLIVACTIILQYHPFMDNNNYDDFGVLFNHYTFSIAFLSFWFLIAVALSQKQDIYIVFFNFFGITLISLIVILSYFIK